jgi:hypothetical protein
MGMRVLSVGLGVLTLMIPLAATSSATVKPGAACKIAGQAKIVNQKEFKCGKKDGKLVWSAGKKVITPKPSTTIAPQIPAITFADLEKNIESIAQTAWAKSNPLWIKNESKIKGVTLLFGPSKKPLNCYGGLTELTRISNFWGKYKQPEKTVAIYAAPEDNKWAAGEFLRVTGTNGPVNSGAGVATVTPQGIGQIVFYVSGDKSPSNCGGGIEKHEYTHVVQLSQRSKSGQLLSIWPPTWFLEGQAEFAGSSEFPFEYYKKFSSLNRLVPQGALKDSEPATISAFLQTTSSLTFADYSVGYQVIEILAAVGGPHSTMDVIVEMANGKNFSEAFEAVYKTSWAQAVTIISNVISAQLKASQNVPLSQFGNIKGEIGTFKWPERGYFDEALFN